MRYAFTCEELHRWYIDEQQGVAAIAMRCGCSPATISNHLRRCGIPTRSGRFVTQPINHEELQRLYSDEGLPLRAIAAMLGVSISTINNRRRAFGIAPRRSILRAPSHANKIDT